MLLYNTKRKITYLLNNEEEALEHLNERLTPGEFPYNLVHILIKKRKKVTVTFAPDEKDSFNSNLMLNLPEDLPPIIDFYTLFLEWGEHEAPPKIKKLRNKYLLQIPNRKAVSSAIALNTRWAEYRDKYDELRYSTSTLAKHMESLYNWYADLFEPEVDIVDIVGQEDFDSFCVRREVEADECVLVNKKIIRRYGHIIRRFNFYSGLDTGSPDYARMKSYLLNLRYSDVKVLYYATQYSYIQGCQNSASTLMKIIKTIYPGIDPDPVIEEHVAESFIEAEYVIYMYEKLENGEEVIPRGEAAEEEEVEEVERVLRVRDSATYKPDPSTVQALHMCNMRLCWELTDNLFVLDDLEDKSAVHIIKDRNLALNVTRCKIGARTASKSAEYLKRVMHTTNWEKRVNKHIASLRKIGL